MAVEEAAAAAGDERVGVVLVTGGLGAGKSRAVSALLAALQGARAGVLTHSFALSFGLETTPVHARAAFTEDVYGVHARLSQRHTARA